MDGWRGLADQLRGMNDVPERDRQGPFCVVKPACLPSGSCAPPMSKRGGEGCERSKIEGRRRKEDEELPLLLLLLFAREEDEEPWPRPVAGAAVAGRELLLLDTAAFVAGLRREEERVVTIVAVGRRLVPDTKMRAEAGGCAVDGLGAGIPLVEERGGNLMNAQNLYNISAKKDAFLAPDLSHCTLPYGSVLYRVQWYCNICKYLRPSAQTERVHGSSSGVFSLVSIP